MEFDISNIEALLPRKKFYHDEWWWPKIDIYRLLNPTSKQPKQALKALMRACQKEGIDIPTQQLILRTHDGQHQPYACTNREGLRLILGRKGTLKGRQLLWQANSDRLYSQWKRKVEEGVKKGRVRCEFRDGEKWYAVSDMMGAIRTYYSPLTPPSMGNYIKRQNGKTDGYLPWGGRDLYFRDRGQRWGAGFTYCVTEGRLEEFFQALWELREVHRKDVEVYA